MIKHILTFLIFSFPAWCGNGMIDTVYSFIPGQGQNTGQEKEYFPQNIFGTPSPNANADIPESNPVQVLSLGFGGQITVGFRGNILKDGTGTDFIIFENAFKNPVNGKMFAEPGIVSVSSNGKDFTEFPYDFATLQGCAGLIPTVGGADPYDETASGGDKFDLAAIGMDHVRYIRITDITEQVLNDPGHEYYDAVLTGFDLDAIAGLHLEPDEAGVGEESEKDFVMAGGRVIFSVPTHYSVADISGRILARGRGSEAIFGVYGNGMYLVSYGAGKEMKTIKALYAE